MAGCGVEEHRRALSLEGMESPKGSPRVTSEKPSDGIAGDDHRRVERACLVADAHGYTCRRPFMLSVT
jgi:hypothetical protein